MSSSASPVWLITGASSGLGKELVNAAINQGFNVIATARTLTSLDILQNDKCKALHLDVTDPPDVLKLRAQEAVNIWGRIDVLVNCAGTTVLGAVEELGHEAFLAQYNTNVFGVVNTTSAFLPFMREAKKGTIVVIGSRSAWEANAPMMGAYASSKAAVHAIAETLSAELSTFKIRVLLVEPGSMRTRNLKAAMELSLGLRATTFADYAPFRAVGQNKLEVLDGKQPGDPTKAARAIIDTVTNSGHAEGKGWPTILALGQDAVRSISAKCEQVRKALADLEGISKSMLEIYILHLRT